MDPLTILAALAPVGVDFAKAMIGKFIGQDFKPANISDYLAMRKADLDQFIAINAAGGTGTTYLWVEAVKQLMRPAVGAMALGVWTYSHTMGTPSAGVDNFAACIGFYLFGDRTLFYIRKG